MEGFKMVNNLLTLGTVSGGKVEKIFKAVVKKIEKKDGGAFSGKQVVTILADQVTCFAIPIYLFQTSNEIQDCIEVSVIVLSPRMADEPKEIVTYTVAHELAHVYLGHKQYVADLSIAKQNELDADQQVIEWGFKDELLSTPHNYLYGSGI